MILIIGDCCKNQSALPKGMEAQDEKFTDQNYGGAFCSGGCIVRLRGSIV